MGGGLAGLSAAIYLGRAERDVLVIDSGKSMARWEPDVQNYLGFPEGIPGSELLRRAGIQARRYGTRFARDEIARASRARNAFRLRGRSNSYRSPRLLLATGIFHVPPDIPQLEPCLGHSMFFCKDCDGYRVRGKNAAVYGWTNEAVDYALGLLSFTPAVGIVTDGRQPRWDSRRAGWVQEYAIQVFRRPIRDVHRKGNQLLALEMDDGAELKANALFTTRGDIFFNRLATDLGAKVDRDGQILVDHEMRTSVPGLYAAGCVTPANCQMVIAAGQGATAAQALNRDLFDESLTTHSLRRLRGRQLRNRKRPAALPLRR